MHNRLDIINKLQGETLVRKGLMKKHDGIERLRLVPELNVVKIVGHGVIDYGKEVVIPRSAPPHVRTEADCRRCRR